MSFLETLWKLSKEHPAAVGAFGTVVLAAVGVLQLLGVGTAISATVKRFILGSTQEGKDSELKIPLEGDFGPNLLSGEVETADTGRDYSLSAEAPQDHGIRVRVSAPNVAESPNSNWSVPGPSKVGWKGGHLDREEYARDFQLSSGEHGDLQINFSGSGTLKIELFEHDQGSPDREIEVDWG